MAAGEKFEVVQPHRHSAVLGTSAHATHADAAGRRAAAPRTRRPAWAELSFDDRAAVFLKAADLLAGPWRQTLNAATMLGQSKTATQAEIDAACELIDFWRFNVHFARQIMAEQPESSAGRLEPGRPPPARGLRLRDHAVQLHRDRRQPAHRPGADGQHRRLEAGADPAVRRALPDAAARGGGPAAGRDQHGAPATASPSPRSRWPSRDLAGIHFTGSTAGLPAPVADGRREHRLLPRLPADRRRDRRQGLRRRPPLGRRRRAAHRAGPRRLRVPGPEVLGGLARLRAAQLCGRGCATTWSPPPSRCRWATSPTSRTSWARSSTGSRSRSCPACSTGRRTTTR